jgi:hypothetical protein
LAESGYLLKEREGRRNRYRIQRHLKLGEKIGRKPTIGEVLGLLVEAKTSKQKS